MSCDALVLPAIRGLTPYQTGKPIDELQRELGLTRVSKLASNENPLGCSFDVVKACQAILEDMARYPDGAGFALKNAISGHFSLDANGLVLGNGSNDVLELIGRTFAGAGDEVIFSQYAFAVYAITTQAIGATAVVVPAKDYAHDLAAMAAAISDKTKLIYLANPNNPTGTCFGQAEWDAFMAKVPKHVLVVLDEAYTEYVSQADYADGLRELAKYDNLIVTRTFSKAYGLAGFRLGFAACFAEIASYINRVRQPFNVNSLAMVAGIAALADQEFVQESVAVNRKGMTIWQQALSLLGLEAIPSQGNFLCVDMGQPAQPLYEALLREGVIVRPVGAYGLPNHLRISIGTDEENMHGIEALTKVLGK
ncbi:MAG TPA: histidinol-phosphate transaminase [Thiotrichales bacterium]|nr:MAG: histidinol-phosphate transaminase [Thiotrichales bacterium 35-46-9]HQR82073.1 histidinol-phosphate transaminase [Thiotrichales bacterium]HQR95889.1 histidinol-phosphate transaminase [Thiotrichales bacterium]